jgi:hypothetical protein
MAMLPNEIVAYWGKENLVRWPESAVRILRIPNSSKDFLIHVGLPCIRDWTLRFDPMIDNLRSSPTRSSLRQFGRDDIVPLCVDEAGGGQVLADEAAVGGTERFVNSSVECFAEFLVLYRKYRVDVGGLSDEDSVQSFISTIEDEIRKSDSKAFGSANNYWSVIIEQAKDGLL